jgi:hypothetical protein
VLTLLVMSILLATFLLPAALSSGRTPRKALRSLLLSMVAVNVGYAFFLRFVFERLK